MILMIEEAHFVSGSILLSLAFAFLVILGMFRHLMERPWRHVFLAVAVICILGTFVAYAAAAFVQP